MSHLSQWKDMAPTGAVAFEAAHWKVGDGTPNPGGALGYDLTWLDADGSIVGQRVLELAGKTPITEAEYEALFPAWEALGT